MIPAKKMFKDVNISYQERNQPHRLTFSGALHKKPMRVFYLFLRCTAQEADACVLWILRGPDVQEGLQ